MYMLQNENVLDLPDISLMNSSYDWIISCIFGLSILSLRNVSCGNELAMLSMNKEISSWSSSVLESRNA